MAKSLSFSPYKEEIGLCGSSSIEEKYISGIDFGYTLDGDGAAGSAYTAGPSEYTLDFTCKGIAAHAGMAPEKGTNAIAMAGLGISLCPTGRIDDETTCNIGLIEGGTAVNIVPDRCVVHCEARSRNDENSKPLSLRWKLPSRKQPPSSRKDLWKSRKKRHMTPSASKTPIPPSSSSAPHALKQVTA